MRGFEISWVGKHFGEEPAISGSIKSGGSGAIFFCRCNLKCVYCQNWQISHKAISCKTVSEAELLSIFFQLQDQGASNINLVSPTIWASKLRGAIRQAKERGLAIPIVWNSNAYETVASLKRLDDLVDIYLPDYKYASEAIAVKYSNAPGYPKIAAEAIAEMHRQVGDLKTSEQGIAQKGLIIRHLVLPGQLDNTRKCLEFIRSISERVHLSLMSQYNPNYRAGEFPEINRFLTRNEHDQVLKMVEEFDFKFGWIQEFGESAKCLNPDFRQEKPFKMADF